MSQRVSKYIVCQKYMDDCKVRDSIKTLMIVFICIISEVLFKCMSSCPLRLFVSSLMLFYKIHINLWIQGLYTHCIFSYQLKLYLKILPFYIKFYEKCYNIYIKLIYIPWKKIPKLLN